MGGFFSKKQPTEEDIIHENHYQALRAKINAQKKI